MVLQSAGPNVLVLMMRVDRALRCETIANCDWLLYGPTDPDIIADVGDRPDLLAAE
ncbi:hypothetical protein [Caulobacter henricii]|uniref:hypothetical protein n=1 Tax=Caulobacter henricii TaxID=69395 RepID=UPI000AB9BC69|nr:hypothetical protein [Caulobacter henricii]